MNTSYKCKNCGANLEEFNPKCAYCSSANPFFKKREEKTFDEEKELEKKLNDLFKEEIDIFKPIDLKINVKHKDKK
ncbi:MAG: hypothetical protein E7374_02080 [Clostridiales bacterium]|nr:hypothetical protein [Clostridiales bacterium]